jgi:hypothetical protein
MKNFIISSIFFILTRTLFAQVDYESLNGRITSGYYMHDGKDRQKLVNDAVIAFDNIAVVCSDEPIVQLIHDYLRPKLVAVNLLELDTMQPKHALPQKLKDAIALMVLYEGEVPDLAKGTPIAPDHSYASFAGIGHKSGCGCTRSSKDHILNLLTINNAEKYTPLGLALLMYHEGYHAKMTLEGISHSDVEQHALITSLEYAIIHAFSKTKTSFGRMIPGLYAYAISEPRVFYGFYYSNAGDARMEAYRKNKSVHDMLLEYSKSMNSGSESYGECLSRSVIDVEQDSYGFCSYAIQENYLTPQSYSAELPYYIKDNINDRTNDFVQYMIRPQFQEQRLMKGLASKMMLGYVAFRKVIAVEGTLSFKRMKEVYSSILDIERY